MKKGFLFLIMIFLIFVLSSSGDCTNLNNPILVSKTSAFVGEEIDFHANTQVQSYLSWDFGDGTIINGVQNPKYSYLDTGTYTVHLIKTNSNCSDTQKVSINVVLPTNILELNKELIIGKDYVEIYESSGKLVYKGVLENSIIMPSDFGLKSGYYIICIKNSYTIKLIKQINIPK